MSILRRLLPVLVAGIALMPGCAPKRPYDSEAIDAIRAQTEAFVRAQSLMGYGSWVHGLPSNQDSLYRANAGLFTLETVRTVAAARDAEPDSVQRLRLRYLHRFLAMEYLSKQTAPITDRVNNLEASARVVVDGREILYRQIGSLMANETAQGRRAALYLAAGPVLDSLNALLLQVRAMDRRSVKELGYASYTDMAEQLKGFSLVALKGTAERLLTETQEQYTMLLREMLTREVHIAPERFYRYDTPLLFRSRMYDRYFPEAGMLPTLHSMYAGMGIPIDSIRALTIDTTALPAKNPRAVCFNIDVPTDIRLSIKPVGGAGDYRGLFHEMGHGLHYAHTREQAFEFKYLGENTVTETFAFLSEYLLENQSWLRMRSGMPTATLKDYVRLNAFLRLYMVRRYAAKILYELELRSDAADPSGTYATLMSRAVGTVPFPDDAKRYLTDIDAMFYSATYLRAWFLQAQLDAALTREYGVNWFENPGAGEFLRSLWARGDRLNGDELAVALGAQAIAPDDLLRAIALMVTFSTRPGV